MSNHEEAQTIVYPVACAIETILTERDKEKERVQSLLKENAQLRDQIAGNTRALPEGTTLEDQHREVLRMINEVGKRCVDGTLKSFALFWEDGKQIVLHAKADQKPLIQVATSIS